MINNKRHFVLNDSKINGKFNTFNLKIKFKGKYVYLNELDDEEFGKYLNSLKQNTQFILITHKKKTMEYVDTLYGITMQESGVSKLVSVKLEEKK